jgi:hypothetical protein
MGIAIAQRRPRVQMLVADVLLSRKSEMRREIKDFLISAPPKYIHKEVAKTEFSRKV